MKKIGFIGAYDKTDLIIYIAKILTTLKKKVLVIDATTKQKARYVVPVINPTKMYVTEYEEIDIAVGFPNIEDIKRIIKQIGEEILQGKIHLKPTNHKGNTPCQYCEYHSICGFDARNNQNKYEYIENLSKDDIIRKMK